MAYKTKYKPEFLDKYVGKINGNASELHVRVREFLKKQFPACQVLEEVFLPGDQLYLDFYIPNLKLVIEIDGGYHLTEEQIKRDNNKDYYYKSRGLKVIHILIQLIEAKIFNR